MSRRYTEPIAEYSYYNSDLKPLCSAFTPVPAVPAGTPAKYEATGTTVNISDLNWAASTYFDYNWAIIWLNPNFIPGINSILQNAGQFGSQLGITSAYRNPGKEVLEYGGKAWSRHVWGDAVDLATFRDDSKWKALLSIVQTSLASYATNGGPYCIEPEVWSTFYPKNTSRANPPDPLLPTHLHVDWEPPGSQNNPPTQACLSKWILPTGQPQP